MNLGQGREGIISLGQDKKYTMNKYWSREGIHFETWTRLEMDYKLYQGI